MSAKPQYTPNTIYKIVIAGPVGAGKTEATNILSDKKALSTEAKTSDCIIGDKRTITVAMDYGITMLDSGEQVHLYGTPGHKRFDFMWDILSKNALGLMLLINAKAVNPIADLQDYLGSFLPLMAHNTIVIGITHAENAPADLHQRIIDCLLTLDTSAHVMTVDARNHAQMRQLLHTLIDSIGTQV